VRNSVKYFRKLAKLSQHALGAKVGLSFQTVSNYENSEAAPEQFLRRAAEVLEVSYEELSKPPPDTIEETPPEFSENVLPLAALTKDQLESLFNSMSGEVATADPERKRLLYESISRLAEELKKRTQ
jgi:transcriptional regulator with XRE-family HTH domain